MNIKTSTVFRIMLLIMTSNLIANPDYFVEYMRVTENAYVDTGIVPDNHQIEVAFEEDTCANRPIFGTKNTSDYFSFYTQGTTWTSDANKTRSSLGAWTGGEHTLIFNDFQNHQIILDGHLLGTATNAAASQSICIARRFDVCGFSGRIRYFKIKDSSGLPVRDLRPCVSNGVALFFDLVSRTYFPRLGEGQFTAGPDLGGQLRTSGSPFDVSPSVTNGLFAGDSFMVGVPLTQSAGHGMLATCVGWNLYSYDETVGEYVIDQSRPNAAGTTNAFTYTHTGVASKLEWLYELSDPDGTGDIYVAEYGDDNNDGLSWNSPKRTIQKAVDQAIDGQVILVAKGKYYGGDAISTSEPGNAQTKINVALLLNKPVMVVSTHGSRLTTINANGTSTRRVRIVEISHENAALDGFTLINGSSGGVKTAMGGVRLSAGSISNCTIGVFNSWAAQAMNMLGNSRAKGIVFDRIDAFNSQGEGDLILRMSENAFIDGLTLTNQFFGLNSPGSMIVLYNAARLRNALVADNRMGKFASDSWKPLIQLRNSARLESSTIARNKLMGNDGAVQLESSSMVTNCVFFENRSPKSDVADFHPSSSLANVYASCSLALTSGERGNITANPGFRNPDAGDYRLRPSSQCVNVPVETAMESTDFPLTTDIDGNARVVGGLIDFGCHELQDAPALFPLDCIFDVTCSQTESWTPLTVDFDAHLNVDVVPDHVLWDFGDGSSSTNFPSVRHTYTTPGLYSATLTVTHGGQTALHTQNGFLLSPEICYIKEGGGGVFPYDSWDKATDSLADATELRPRKILVTNGVYQIEAPALALPRAVLIQSVDGCDGAILDSVSLSGARCHRHFTFLDDNAVVSGFTLIHGAASYSDSRFFAAVAEMHGGVLSNCVVKETQRISRSPVINARGNARLTGCVLDGSGLVADNTTEGMGGLYLTDNAIADRCRISGYDFAGQSATILKSAVMLNSANATLRNSLVCSNRNSTVMNEKYVGVVQIKNGTVENCTISDNAVGGYGGGVAFLSNKGVLRNSIVYGNVALMDYNDLYCPNDGPVIEYSCAPDILRINTTQCQSNTASGPSFSASEPYRLSSLSQNCINRATIREWMLEPGAIDMQGNPRIDEDDNLPDMGCFEFVRQEGWEELNAHVHCLATLGRTPFTTTFTATVAGGDSGLEFLWQFGDGTADNSTLSPSHTYNKPGCYDVTLRLQNGDGQIFTVIMTNAIVAVPEVSYVSTNGLHIPPFADWTSAATNIADAVALAPMRVVVSNGTYGITGEGLSVATNTAIVSVNGPRQTILKGMNNLDGQTSSRIFWLRHKDAILDGFTIIRGGTEIWGDAASGKLDDGTMRNCVVSNQLWSFRAASIIASGSSLVQNCEFDLANISGNPDADDFFTLVICDNAMIDRCEIRGYTLTGTRNLNRKAALRVSDNAVARNCLIHNSTIVFSENATEISRSPVFIDGNATIENCTIVSNTVSGKGGGLCINSTAEQTPVARNLIFAGNTSSSALYSDIYDAISPDSPRVSNSCSQYLAAGHAGNISALPLFLGRAPHPYIPHPDSPCLNAAEPLPWMIDSFDLAGSARIRNGVPDMGCYEGSLPGGTIFLVR